MNLPSICICTAAAKANVNRVWEAMGRGPGTFSRKLCAVGPGATWETKATHYLMSDASTDDGDIAEWQAMSNGDLPAIAGVWGADGVIGAADAQAAVSGANLQVYSASGDVLPTEHAEGVLSGRGLMFVPDPEI